MTHDTERKCSEEVGTNCHDIYIKRIGFSLIRVYRFQKNTQNTNQAEQLMSQLKWPIETIFMGMRPKFNTKSPVYSGLNVTSGNENEWRDWHRLTRLVDRSCYTIAAADALLPTGNGDPTLLTIAANFTTVDTSKSRSLKLVEKLTYPQSIKTIDTLKVVAHGINIYQDIDVEFFSDYEPYIYGGYNIVTPDDEGAVMINFCLYPGTYQPSGHINISRAREFYINYTSSFVGSNDSNDPSNPQTAEAEMLVLAIAINFLLISDGSAKPSTLVQSCQKTWLVVSAETATQSNCGKTLRVF